MKITRRQLKRIINEELQHRIKESSSEGHWYDNEHETLADKKFSDGDADGIADFADTDRDNDVHVDSDITNDDWLELRHYEDQAWKDTDPEYIARGQAIEAEYEADKVHRSSAEELARMTSPEEGEDEPKRMGMGRRPLVGPARDVRRGRKISESKMKITRTQLRRIIKEEIQRLNEMPMAPSGPGPQFRHQSDVRKDIVHGRIGEIYEEGFLESEFAVWLRKNPEYRRANPGETNTGWWGTDTLDDSQWYVDGPEEGPAWTLGSRDWSLDPKPDRRG